MLIAHRCTKCTHPDYQRREVKGEPGPCRCGCKCTPDQPELLPTFDTAGRKVERILKPGEKLGAGVDNGLGHVDGGNITTCPCGDCKALHEQLTRLGPARGPGVAEHRDPGTAGPRQMRKWANEVGMDCPPRGRIPASVVEAYAAAHTN